MERELCVELARISERNLSRDDRMVADCARESRTPYLDEHLLYAMHTTWPIHVKCDLTLARALGDKLLLRLAARAAGLENTCVRPKRAMQFGSRIAKNEAALDVDVDVDVAGLGLNVGLGLGLRLDVDVEAATVGMDNVGADAHVGMDGRVAGRKQVQNRKLKGHFTSAHLT